MHVLPCRPPGDSGTPQCVKRVAMLTANMDRQHPRNDGSLRTDATELEAFAALLLQQVGPHGSP